MVILHWVNSPKTITKLICIDFLNWDEFYAPIRGLICLSHEPVIYTFGCSYCKIVDVFLFFSLLFTLANNQGGVSSIHSCWFTTTIWVPCNTSCVIENWQIYHLVVLKEPTFECYEQELQELSHLYHFKYQIWFISVVVDPRQDMPFITN